MITEIVVPSSLRIHPLLREAPPPPPELLESMLADIEERGIDDPLIVDEKNRVMGGRIRLRIALDLRLPEVVITRRSSAEAATIIVQSLLQRRHYSRSALAYLAFPLFETMFDEARDRQMACLKRGESRSTQNVLRGATVEAIARNAGVSRALFFQARELHKAFAKNPAAREQFEPKILSGELCLGYAINGVAGQASTAGRSRGEVHQLELFSRGISTLRIRFSKWEMIPAKNRTFIANEFAEAIADAPAEIQERVLATLKAQKASHKGH